MPPLRQITDFVDIHTHNMAAGDDAVICLPPELLAAGTMPPTGFYSVGLHPWDTADASDGDIDAVIANIALLAADPRVIAIGEAGLDSLRGAPLPRQEDILRRQIAISEAARKPLVIHAVKTLNRIIELRRELRPTQRWIIHGFRGKPQQARQLLDAGVDISLGARFNPAVPAVVPPHRLFHETD